MHCCKIVAVLFYAEIHPLDFMSFSCEAILFFHTKNPKAENLGI